MSVSSSQPLSLRDDSIFRLFWRYTLPTIAAMLVTGIYVAVDGMFVGHFIGEDGLAAIILGYPIGSILYAIGALIGMGASALVSIKLGEDKTDEARKIVGNAFSLCLIAAMIICGLGITFGTDILKWVGAEGKVLSMAEDYLFWYFSMGFFAIISIAFSSLLRNDGQPKRVTYIMIFGGLLNIFLDWLFIVVIPWGLSGAAIATMLSQAATSILCLQHFFSDKSSLRIHWDSLKLKLDICLQILKLGTSSLLMYMYLSVVLILHNKAFLIVGKPIHVAAYGIVSYTEAFFYLIFEGIALGTQPITSFNTGAGLKDRVIKARNLAFAVTLTVAFIGVTILYSLPDYVVYLFAGDNQLLQPVAINGMHLYFWGLPFEGLLLIGATYFQSINMAKEASILTGGKLILISIFIFTFAHIFGVDGVWVALPFCSFLLTSWMIIKIRKI
ncbi:MATE family efflux transporter [Photobacterium angustum]|uniref:Multidrug export protein MepA n=1 Tax=Photobacterium angustum (strain S14 / CCUG 15956) TaxID=314292 RepID=Q1ZVU0_PHOAS|nr:MATE family efflux transporter [Photobacterium angustum]EAS65970.1 putative MATE efflux family protein [Photobacterium angustum S14]